MFIYVYRRRSFLFVLTFVVLSFLSGCGKAYSVKTSSPVKIFRRRASSALDSNRPSSQSVQTLRLLFLEKQYRRDRQGTIEEVQAIMLGNDDPELAITAAELSLLEARRLYPRSRDGALGMYLNAAGLAWDFLFFSPPDDEYHPLTPSYRFMAEVYNRSVSRLVQIAQEKDAPWLGGRIEIIDRVYEITVVHEGEGVWDPVLFDKIIPSNQIEVRGLANEYFSRGLGAPLVGFVDDPRSKPEFGKYNPENGIAFPMTAILAFSPQEVSGDVYSRSITLTFYDPLDDELITINDHSVPLEADYSTPLGVLLAEIQSPEYGFDAMFRPDVFLDDAGLVMLEPYREDQIPVVMVHGLFSSPATWVAMFNDLRGDPVIRENFQFWFFRYPTGLPIIYSASLLREELLDIQKTFGSGEGKDNFDKMVLVGHSMGGLLTRLMVQDSGSYYYDDVFKVPVDELSVGAEQKELIREVLFFEALGFVKRAVFIATPHRGSSEAETFFAGLGAGFITLPGILNDLGSMLKENEEALTYDPAKRKRPVLTSIDQLSPSSAFIKVMQRVPIRVGIPYHSIIAIRNSKTAEGSSDGIVTYESAHIDFAVSEKLVPSPHFAQKHPVTIGEIKRILRVHLAEYRPLAVTFDDR